MRRARVVIAIGFAIFVFLGISGLLARALGGVLEARIPAT